MPYVETLPSGKYRARYRGPDGKLRSAGVFVHKKPAKDAAVKAEGNARSLGWRDPESAKRTWKEWCDEWWPTRDVEPGTLHRDESARDVHLMPKWGTTPLLNITRQDVKAWAASLKKEGLAASTIQKRVYLLSASLNAAIDAEVLIANPAYKLKLNAPRHDVIRFLTADEADSLLLQFGVPARTPENEALVKTLLRTGMRWGEAVGLQIRRVDFKSKRIHVVEVWDTQMRRLKAYPKSRKVRHVPIVPELEPYLRFAIGARKSGFVFHPAGHVIDYANWRRETWLPAIACAKLDGTRIHDLRHTYASWALQNGVSLAEVGALLGHTSPQTTQIYAHLTTEYSDRLLEALARGGRGANVEQTATATLALNRQE